MSREPGDEVDRALHHVELPGARQLRRFIHAVLNER
jgi:hypothetical protein